MAQDSIRVGVIGAGDNTRKKHIPGLQKLDDVEVVAVTNRTLESGQRVADQLGIPIAYSDWREIIYSDEVDAVCIGTWPYMHAPLTIAALDAGKHVLVEARMAMNSMEALAMLETSKANPGQIAQIVPAPHTLSVDATIIDMISDGYIGDLITLNAQIAQPRTFTGSDSPVHWRHDRDLSGNNIMSMGIWYEILMRWAGEAERVAASGKIVVEQRADCESGAMREVHVPEHLDIIAHMANGAQAHFSISSIGGHAPASEIVLRGDQGTLRFADGTLTGGRAGDAGLAEIEPRPEEQGEWRVEAEFVGAIRGKETIRLTDFDTGVRYMAFTEAVHRSMEEGRTVDVERD